MDWMKKESRFDYWHGPRLVSSPRRPTSRWWNRYTCLRLRVSGPSPAKRARLLFFNRAQSRVVTGLLTGHNTLMKHIYVMGLSNNHICWKCGTEEETSVHIFCECEALVSLRHAYLRSFFLESEDIMNLSTVVMWNFGKGKRLPWTGSRLWGTKGLF